MAQTKRHDVSMTQGNILKLLIAFAIPLLIGNIFQQLYNTVDSIIVGNFVSKQALAAVGSTGPIINAIIGIFNGFATGMGVVISQYYGAGDEAGVKKAVHTTMSVTFILCVVLSLLGVALVPAMLRMMSTPEDVFAESQNYLVIYFAGLTGLMIYNIGAGILRAVGDSKRPLYFLIVSALLNIVLDLLFVVKFSLGISGVAYATIISQLVSGILVLIVLMKTNGTYRFSFKFLCINKTILSQITKVGLPSAIQMGITSLSNIFVQGYINSFGSTCMAAYTSYQKIDQFAILPTQSIALSTTTFVGQNLGAEKIDRVKKGANIAMAFSFAITAICILPLIIFAPSLISMFNSEADVITYGAYFIRILSPFYFAFCVNQILSSVLRGAGDTKAPMYIMLISFVAFRQVYLFLASRYIGTEVSIVIGYPLGWVLCSILIFIYYKFSNWDKRRII